MDILLIEAGRNLPQAPTEVTEALNQSQSWTLATENFLNGNSTALKALVTVHASTEGIEIDELRTKALAQDKPVLRKPNQRDFRSAAKYSSLGVIDFDQDEDRCTYVHESEHVRHMAMALVGLCHDTKIPVPVFSSSLRTTHGWDTMLEFTSARKASLLMAVAQGGPEGVTTTQAANRSDDNFSPKGLHSIFTRLEHLGLVTIDKTVNLGGHTENLILPSGDLIDAVSRFRGILKSLIYDPGILETIGNNSMGALNEKGAIASVIKLSSEALGRKAHTRIIKKHDRLVEILSGHPEGLELDELFEIAGEELGYNSPESLSSSITNMRVAVPADCFRLSSVWSPSNKSKPVWTAQTS